MLDKQIAMYSIDTGHFFSNQERYFQDKICKYQSEKKCLTNKTAFLDDVMKLYGYSQRDLACIKNGTISKLNIIPETSSLIREYFFWHSRIKYKRKKIKSTKETLLTLLSHKTSQNEKTHGKDHTRTLREQDLNDSNIISVFDSALCRTIHIKQNELTETLIVVQVYYFEVFKDISFYGFQYKGKNYRYFTSSAGQIRQKKAIFMEEDVWNTIEKTIMCGLTVNKINLKGGNNVNKYLAYMALANSATDLWKEFDIDKTIVIDDFTTNVYGTFDFIDETDYSITRKTDYVPITHTDGAGMILPSVSERNFMFRAPWIKGLLGSFDFKRFIEVNHCSPTIIDIYGQEHDIIAENIQIIFTKSQFKMYKYYDSWEEYKAFFKKYNCTAGICNMDEKRIKNAKLNYQMLQTLTDITDEEIDFLTRKSAERISNICQSKETMMEILGITPYNTNMTPFQKAVKIYPALLSDPYAKDVLRQVKDSLVKKYRSGKLEVTGKYTFILPDFYAACEHWFMHCEKPKGLLEDTEVFCRMFENHKKLDCLRSPHLYREHAIRFNVADGTYGERSQRLGEWFATNALYTSTHDLISKLLQFDVDGDKSLVVADPDFIKIAERNMVDVVPLYYNMRKAEPTELNSKNIYAGLNAAFTGSNIGAYSNDISKIWNHDVFVNGTEEQKQEAITVIKLLCMENNFVIDRAKTLYMPKRPDWFQPLAAKYTNTRLPAFFEFAKDKEKSQTETRNKSCVNRIYSRIPNKPINTLSLHLGTIEYQSFMGNAGLRCTREVSELYNNLNRQYRFMINMKEEFSDNLTYVACQIRKQFDRTGYSEETIADMLAEYLYGHEKRYKQLFWFCYGQYAVKHLEKNLAIRKTKIITCIVCGDPFETPLASKSMRCNLCRKEWNKEKARLRVQKYRNLKCNDM